MAEEEVRQRLKYMANYMLDKASMKKELKTELEELTKDIIRGEINERKIKEVSL